MGISTARPSRKNTGYISSGPSDLSVWKLFTTPIVLPVTLKTIHLYSLICILYNANNHKTW